MHRSRMWGKPIALGSILVLAVAACGGSTPAPTGGASAPASSAATAAPGQSAAAAGCGDQALTLNVWGGYPEMDAVYTKAGEAFKATHPNVSFTVFSTDLRGFEQKLTTALPTGTAGDVIARTTNFLARFIDQDLLLPIPADLLTYVKSGAFVPSLLEDASYKGEVRGVP